MPNAKTEFFMTPQGRFCYQFLDEPRKVDLSGKPLDEPKFEVVMYLPKTNPDPQQCKTYQLLAAKVWEVVKQQFRGQWPQLSPRGEWIDWPIDDCDADPPALEKAPWGRGCWKIRLSGGKYRPRVFDAQNNPIEVGVDGKFYPGTFKSGDYGFASINAYGWEYSNVKKGVSFGLEGVKKIADGDPIGGGGRSAQEMFGGAPPASAAPAIPAANAPQAVYGGAPPAVPRGSQNAGPYPGPMAAPNPAVPYPDPMTAMTRGFTPGGPAPMVAAPYAPASAPVQNGMAGQGYGSAGYPSSATQGMPPAPPTFGPPVGTR